MNKLRRKEIEVVLADLASMRSRIEVLKEEEQDSFDNLSEGLQASKNGQASEAAAAALQEAIDALEEAESALNEAQS